MKNINEIKKGDKVFVEDIDSNYAVGEVVHKSVEFLIVKVDDTEDFHIEFLYENITKLEKIEYKKAIGRPSIGVTKKVSITLSENDWERLEVLKSYLDIKSNSELMRYIIGLKLEQKI